VRVSENVLFGRAVSLPLSGMDYSPIIASEIKFVKSSQSTCNIPIERYNWSMKKTLLTIIIFGGFFINTAHGATVQDINQPTGIDRVASNLTPWCQSFKPTKTNITGVGLWIGTYQAGTMTFGIYTGLDSNCAGGTKLAETITTTGYSGYSNAMTEQIIQFTKTTVVPNNTYYIRIIGSAGVTGVRTYHTFSDVYAGGQLYDYNGGSSGDLRFTTYYDDTPDVAPTPVLGTTTPATDSQNFGYLVGLGSIGLIIYLFDFARRNFAGLTR